MRRSILVIVAALVVVWAGTYTAFASLAKCYGICEEQDCPNSNTGCLHVEELDPNTKKINRFFLRGTGLAGTQAKFPACRYPKAVTTVCKQVNVKGKCTGLKKYKTNNDCWGDSNYEELTSEEVPQCKK